eukprot:2913650-Rhodomonas_salina.1
MPLEQHKKHKGRGGLANRAALTELMAKRSGPTPGMEAPEVLLDLYPQTTALDVWSAGVVVLELVSQRRNPFAPERGSCKEERRLATLKHLSKTPARCALRELVVANGLSNSRYSFANPGLSERFATPLWWRQCALEQVQAP